MSRRRAGEEPVVWTLLGCAWALVILSLWIVIGVVAWHFIAKVW